MTRETITAADIRTAMLKQWAPPQWAVLWEVGQATGFDRGRYADAVMMSLWPSRGLELHGVEIKVSRSDWKREAAAPRKAEAIARYCDRWFVHAAAGVVQDVSEVPPAWGLREWDGKKWRTIREAEKTEAEPITRGFLAALLRRADGLSRALLESGIREARQREIEEAENRRKQYHVDVETAADRKTKALADTLEKIAAFEAAFGADVFRAWGVDFADLGKIARALQRAGVTTRHHGQITDMVQRLRKAAGTIEDALALIGEHEPAPSAERETVE